MKSRIEKHSSGYTKKDKQWLKHNKPRAKPQHQREQDRIEIKERSTDQPTDGHTR